MFLRLPATQRTSVDAECWVRLCVLSASFAAFSSDGGWWKFLSDKSKVRFLSLAARGWWRWDGGTAGGNATLIWAKEKNQTPPGLRFNILTDGI